MAKFITTSQIVPQIILSLIAAAGDVVSIVDGLIKGPKSITQLHIE